MTSRYKVLHVTRQPSLTILQLFADPSNFDRWSPTYHTTGLTIIAFHKIYVTAIDLDGGDL